MITHHGLIIPDGYAYESFRLDEGQAYIICPQRLTPESYEDLKGHVELFLRIMGRCVVKPEPSAALSPPGGAAGMTDKEWLAELARLRSLLGRAADGLGSCVPDLNDTGRFTGILALEAECRAASTGESPKQPQMSEG